jgi:hypothetical protein
VEID